MNQLFSISYEVMFGYELQWRHQLATSIIKGIVSVCETNPYFQGFIANTHKISFPSSNFCESLSLGR